MSLWKNQHLKYVFGALLLITYTSPQTLSAKWFDDLRDFESLEKYSYAKARSYQARADAFNQGTWAQKQFSKLAELWTSLPILYQTSEENLVSEHNKAIDEKIKEETTNAQKEGRSVDRNLLFSDEMQLWTKEGIINSIADQIISIKILINQQKRFRPRLLKTQALTKDYNQAKHDQYLALYEATRDERNLSSLYWHLAKAWEGGEIDVISSAKFEILKIKYEQSTYIQSFKEEKLTNDTVKQYPYNLPNKPKHPFHLTFIPNSPQTSTFFPNRGLAILPLTSNYPAFPIHQFSPSFLPDLFLCPMPLNSIEVNTELVRLAGNAVLPGTAPHEFYWKIKRGWFSATKENVTGTDKKLWTNHLFYSDYLKSTFGISTHESFLVIEELMI